MDKYYRCSVLKHMEEQEMDATFYNAGPLEYFKQTYRFCFQVVQKGFQSCTSEATFFSTLSLG